SGGRPHSGAGNQGAAPRTGFDTCPGWVAMDCVYLKLCAGEDDRARTVGLDDLAGRLQRPVCFHTELHDRVGAFLSRWPEALVGVGRVEKFGCRIEAKK